MNYDPGKFDPNTRFDPWPVGPHRLRIEEAEQAVSKNSGNEMFKVTFSASGLPGRLFHYFVDNEFLQRNIDPFFDSFGIQPGNFNVLSWRGKVGAARIKHEMYQEQPQAKIAFFILKSKQADLPAWIEKGQVGSLREDPGFDSSFANECPF
jgi:hypothetical protein